MCCKKMLKYCGLQQLSPFIWNYSGCHSVSHCWWCNSSCPSKINVTLNKILNNLTKYNGWRTYMWLKWTQQYTRKYYRCKFQRGAFFCGYSWYCKYYWPKNPKSDKLEIQNLYWTYVDMFSQCQIKKWELWAFVPVAPKMPNIVLFIYSLIICYLILIGTVSFFCFILCPLFKAVYIKIFFFFVLLLNCGIVLARELKNGTQPE